MYGIIQAAMCNMAGITPQTFESDVETIIEETEGLMTKEAAAYLVMNNMGFRLDTNRMGSMDSSVFTYLFTRVKHKKR